jgi:hypothetical protein
MNIRTLSNPITPIESLKTDEVRSVKAEVSSEDRDADGKRQDKEPDKNPLSDEEMKRAQEYLENLTGLKANGLEIEIDNKENVRVFLIKDHQGTVVRRILEWELRPLITDKDKKTGQIFDKAV